MDRDWERSRAYYSSLTLARDGDETEQYGAENYRLDERWPAYERFWRFHVAPTTERPASIAFREGVSQPVADLIRANYLTFRRVVCVCDYTAMLQTDASYTRVEDWGRLVSSHALVVETFTELVASASRLIATLGLPPRPLPPDREEWRSLFDRYQAYQSYLAGLGPGSVTWITNEERRIAVVLDPAAIVSASQPAVSAAPATSSSRTRLVDAVSLHLDDLIHVLNVGSGQLIELLEPAQTSRAYHRLWGWYRG